MKNRKLRNNIKDLIMLALVCLCFVPGWYFGIMAILAAGLWHTFGIAGGMAQEAARYKQAYEQLLQETSNY